MTARKSLRKVRGATYRAGSVLGDLNAAMKATETGSVKPLLVRAVRKKATSESLGLLSTLFRAFAGSR